MRFLLTLIAVLLAVSSSAPSYAQRTDRDRLRRYPDRFYDAPSPMVREMRERRIRQPYGAYGPYTLDGNATRQTHEPHTAPNATTTGPGSEQAPVSPSPQSGPSDIASPPTPGHGMRGRSMRDQQMHGGRNMMTQGTGRPGPMSRDMHTIHELFASHRLIERSVQDIENGVTATTTSADPYVTELIRTHVRDMKRRMESGHPVRMWDPVFRELFLNADAIDIQIEQIEGGVRVTETSRDPEIVRLLRQHAHKAVSEFVREGPARRQEPTPLPHGFQPTPGSSRVGLPSPPE